MRPTLMPVLVLMSCATLDTTRMSEACRAEYNRCLNQCPSAQSSPRQPVENQNGPRARWDTTQPLMVDVASCTQACNSAAKTCR